MKRKRKKAPKPGAASGQGPFFPKVQTKLSVGKADDAFEKEADQVADQVVNSTGESTAIQKMSNATGQIQEKPIDSITPVQKMEAKEEEAEPAVQKQEEQEEQPVQKQEEEEQPVQKQEEEEQPVQKQEEEEAVQMKEEEEEAVQMKEEEEEAVQMKEEEEEAVQMKEEEEEAVQMKSNRAGRSGRSVESKLKSSKGGGQKMSKSTQREMEAGFGANFDDVNIHTGSEAKEMSSELGAQAFTSGKDVYFNEGKYDPNSKEGKHLLAHELTHTIQQEGSELKAKAADLKSPRFRGDAILEEVLDGNRLLKHGETGDHVKRIQQALVDAGFTLPKFGVDGKFRSETKSRVRKYQKANALGSDGVVGKNTMAALDLYYSVDRGAEALPPVAGSNEAKMLALLTKGDQMTKAEAKEIRKLLFELNGDDFKRALKAALDDDNFLHWIKKMGIIEILTSAAKSSLEVVIPTTLLKPAADVIDADFNRANQIFNPKGIEIEKGNAKVLDEKESKKVIGKNLVLHEFDDKATREELKMVKHNRVKDRITGYWVPDMSDGSRGEALTKSDLANLPDDRTSVVVNSSNRAQDTFAHEVGHVLGLDHTEDDNIPDTVAGDPNNLLTSGDNRKIVGAGIDQLTDGQLAVIRKSLFIEIGKKGVGK
ncbi:MAG: DUF4157 domain-containing protein [Bacteroidota bacterium]